MMRSLLLRSVLAALALLLPLTAHAQIERAVVSGGVRVQQSNVIDLATGELDLSLTGTITFTDGAGANQVDRLFSDRRTLAASASEDLDLAGVLTDAFGATITNARIKAIVIKASSANTNNVVVGAASSNAFVGFFGADTHTLAIKPGGFLVIAVPDATGWAVTAGTADLLKIANSGGTTTVTYDIAILGAAS